MAASSGSVEQWSSRWGFLLAAIGFSVGLGNIWRFPFVTGQNGGSAFLIIYLVAALVIGLPLLITELSIGRRGRSSPSGSIVAVAGEASASSRWGGIGVLAVFCVFMILTYYTVISGWTLDYLVRSVSGSFDQITATESSSVFDSLMSNPMRLIFWNTVVHICVFLIVRRGVQAGIESAVKVLMPILFGALLVMVVYGFVAGDMQSAAKFLMEPDFSKVTAGTVMSAIGQAFFSIGISMGALIAFGAYLPDDYSVPKSATAIIFADTGVALVAGFAIFPLVFAFGLEPSGGSGLTFITLPIAFGQMPAGTFVGTLFFVLLILAALTSSIGLLEVVVSWLTEETHLSRRTLAIVAGVVTWIIGIGSALSFNLWSEFTPLSMFSLFEHETFFGLIEYLTANIMTPISVLLIAVFGGWVMAAGSTRLELGLGDGMRFRAWRFLIRYVAPLVVALIFVINLV